MGRFKQASLALATAGLLASGAAQAALNDRGGGLIYDDELKITWLSDANYSATQFAATGGGQGDADGLMNWTAANAWADNLSFYDSVRNVTYSDWRLPSALNQNGSEPCVGYNCTNSEMGHMFYNNLGASAGSSILSGSNTANLALFTNLQSLVYWSSTAYAPSPTDLAWLFNTGVGYQSRNFQRNEMYAWAVRPGDVAPVPEPETYAMMLAGLGLLGVMARRRKQNLAA